MDKDLLARFFEGNASLQEEMQIREWMEASPENYQAFFKERKMFDAMTLLTEEGSNSRSDKLAVFKGGWFRKLVEMAAVIAITIAITVFYQQSSDKTHLLAMQKIMVPAGQRISLELSDGTQVWLNSRTKIEYPASFVGDDRKVKLDGEAYFEVTKDTHKPFIVETSKGNIEVLGTKFNVEAYSEGQTFATALMEGSVKVKRGNMHYTLCPNQLAYLKNGKMNIAPIEDFNLYRWREGLICFKNESFPNIIKKFEKYYGVDIRIENSAVVNYHCTGKFRQSDGVLYALRVLQKDVNFTFKRDEDNHIIYIK
ncbi:FecR family protein [Bacteroides rodentium]